MARARTEQGRQVGRRIAELRERHHLTQQAAAQQLQVGYRSYQAWEAGESVPRWASLLKIARRYGVTPEDLLGPAAPDP